MNALQRALPKLTARVGARTPRKHPRLQRQSRRHASQKEGNGPTETPSKPKEVKDETEPVDIPASLWYKRLGPVTNFFDWFHKTQGRRPLTVQLCTTLVTYLCGDLLAQDIGGEPYDASRTLRMLTIGSLASIPGYKWY
jgi:protein Mpv17